MLEYDQSWQFRQKLRKERESIRTTEAAFGQVLGSVEDSVRRCFSRNRRLKGGDLEALIRSIDDAVCSGMAVLRKRLDDRPASKARPKSEAYELMYVVPNLQEADSEFRENVYRLYALRVFGSRKRVTIEAQPLPVAVRGHAAQRLYERADGIDLAVRQLSSSVQEWLVLPAIAEAVALDSAAERFAVPGPGDGIVLGRFDHSAAVPAGLRYTFDGRGVEREEISALPDTPSLYIANTYVGASELHPAQRDLLQCYGMWRDACGVSYDMVLDDAVWPFREIRPASGECLESRLVEAFHALVSDKRALAAMGNLKENFGARPALYPEGETEPCYVPSAAACQPQSANSQNVIHSL